MPTGHCARKNRGATVGREARFQIESNFDYICPDRS
jgi:hypothetical protein